MCRRQYALLNVPLNIFELSDQEATLPVPMNLVFGNLVFENVVPLILAMPNPPLKI